MITSVGFEAAYNKLVPVFQKSSGITVSTKHFASQGNGPDTIAAQLRAGAAADVVIMSKEGLSELLAEGRIIPASAVLTGRRLKYPGRADSLCPSVSGGIVPEADMRPRSALNERGGERRMRLRGASKILKVYGKIGSFSRYFECRSD